MSSSQGRGESTRRDDISSQQRAGPPPQPRSRNPPPGSELNRVSTASSSISQNSSSSSSSSSRQSHMSSSQDGAKNEDSVSSSYSTPGPSAVPPSSSQSTDDGSTTVLLSPTKHVSSSRGYKTTRLLPPTPSLIIPNPNSSSTPPSSVLASSTSSNPTPSTVTQLSPQPPTSVPAIISSKASPATSLQFASYEDGDYERDDYGGDDDGASSGTNSTPTPPASPIYRTGKMQAWSPAPPLSMGMAFTSPTTPSAHSAGSNNANLSGAPNSFLRAQQQQQQRPHTASSASSSMAWTRPGTGTGAGSGVPPLPPIDVVLEDVWIYVSPAAVVARDTRRKERELYDVSPSSPSVVLAGGHGGSSAVGNGSSGGGTGGDRPALRERPSFMNLNKILPGATSSSSSSASPSPAPGGAGATGFSGPSGGGVSGPWRRATLRLTEQIYDQRASSYLLQIQERDHTTHIYLQHHVTTDVRLVHRSLFHLQHVLGIFNSTSSIPTSVNPHHGRGPPSPPFASPSSSSHSHSHSQSSPYGYPTSPPYASSYPYPYARPTSPPPVPTFEPLYLYFPTSSSLATWLALMRSCTRADTLGAQLAPINVGGVCRVWRGIEVNVLNGRNVGVVGASSTSVGVSMGGVSGLGDDSGNGISEKERAKREVSGNLKGYGRAGYGGGANPSHLLSSTSVSGNPNFPDSPFATASISAPPAPSKQLPAFEDDLFCAIYLAGELSGCTSVQGPSSEVDASPVWNEAFAWEDLPAFSDTPYSDRSENNVMRIVVYRVPTKGKSGGLTEKIEKFVPGAGKWGGANDSFSGSGSGGNAAAHMNAGAGSAANSHLASSQSSSSNVPASAFDSINPNLAMAMHSGTGAGWSYPLGPQLFESSSYSFPLSSPPPYAPSSPYVPFGTVVIPLARFRKGDTISGHWPIVAPPGHIPGGDRNGGDGAGTTRRKSASAGSGLGMGSGMVVGELRMKIRVEELTILPLERYRPLLDLIRAQPIIKLVTELENRIGRIDAPALIRGITSAAMRELGKLTVLRKDLVQELKDHINIEVAQTALTSNPLFRLTTTLTLVVQRTLIRYGDAFLRVSIGPVIRNIIEQNVCFVADRGLETDRISDKELANGAKECAKWCEELWNSIYNHREDCPQEMRLLLQHVRNEVETHYSPFKTKEEVKTLRLQGVTAFCFLRFIVPAIMEPYDFSISHATPNPGVVRSLKQIGRVIQALANLSNYKMHFTEDYQKPIQTFMSSHADAMSDYIYVVSTPKPPTFASAEPKPQQLAAEAHNRALKQLSGKLTLLHGESIPNTPVPYNLGQGAAAFTSVITRNTTRPTAPTSSMPRTVYDSQSNEAVASRLDSIFSLCFDIERAAFEAHERLQLRHDSFSRPRSASASSSSSSQSGGGGPYQSFALAPSPVKPGSNPSSGQIYHSTRPTLSTLRFNPDTTGASTSNSIMPSHKAFGRGPIATAPSSPLDVTSLSPWHLEVPYNPLKPTTPSDERPPNDFSISASPGGSSIAESVASGSGATSSDSPRRKSLVRKQSKDLGRSATKKRSGFLRAVLPGSTKE